MNLSVAGALNVAGCLAFFNYVREWVSRTPDWGRADEVTFFQWIAIAAVVLWSPTWF